ncbi:hypothetical protein FOE78_18720 [Microlunatus elymi]|uniref:PspA-associated domain-containing protein n=1 Tax=Microlunatus elymi TaxID=2596828 RepID=A0A516Q383_9ACTN|nr:hypothetical protein [Microlunatus elymi]QDP97671.1 hypothetical protein FOE78_18720 [Microlunatus elymi]
MIIRILGEGQYRVDDGAVANLNSIDASIEQAVSAGDQDALTSQLTKLHAEIIAAGTPVPDDELQDSDLILPAADATLDEVKDLLEESHEGLLPG